MNPPINMKRPGVNAISRALIAVALSLQNESYLEDEWTAVYCDKHKQMFDVNIHKLGFHIFATMYDIDNSTLETIYSDNLQIFNLPVPNRYFTFNELSNKAKRRAYKEFIRNFSGKDYFEIAKGDKHYRDYDGFDYEIHCETCEYLFTRNGVYITTKDALEGE